MATSFANPSSFVATAAGPLGGELVVKASRDGGIGGATIDQPYGTWVGYWLPDAMPDAFASPGSIEIDDNGNLQQLPSDLLDFLGILGNDHDEQDVSRTTSSRQALVDAPTGPVSISLTAMHPIKPASTTRGRAPPEEGFVQQTESSIFLAEEEEEVDDVGQDTVLLSRSKSPHYPQLAYHRAYLKLQRREYQTSFGPVPAR